MRCAHASKMSGWNEDQNHRNGLSHGDACFVPDLFSIEDWIPTVQRVGVQEFPKIDPPRVGPLPALITAFDKRNQVERKSSTFLHFFVSDHKLRRLVTNPRRYVVPFAEFGGLLGPDFSLYRDMPRFQRELHTFVNRALTAFFQTRGLTVIPSVRWATSQDFDFCFLGLPLDSTLAVSPHGCLRSYEDRSHFKEGLEELVIQLKPQRLIVHGPAPARVFSAVPSDVEVIRYQSDLERSRKTES